MQHEIRQPRELAEKNKSLAFSGYEPSAHHQLILAGVEGAYCAILTTSEWVQMTLTIMTLRGYVEAMYVSVSIRHKLYTYTYE